MVKTAMAALGRLQGELNRLHREDAVQPLPRALRGDDDLPMVGIGGHASYPLSIMIEARRNVER